MERFSTPKSKDEIRNEIESGKQAYIQEKNEPFAPRERREASLPLELINTKDFFERNGENGASLVYGWYEKAISRRDRQPLGEDSFFYHFFDGGSSDETLMYGDLKKGYLLGFLKYGVFIPSHFAPKNIRTGYDMIKELGSSEQIPCVMSITEDLVKTITKFPEWKTIDSNFIAEFRGEKHEKYIVYNSHSKVKQLMVGLLNEYMQEQESYGYDDEEEDYDGESVN